MTPSWTAAPWLAALLLACGSKGAARAPAGASSTSSSSAATAGSRGTPSATSAAATATATATATPKTTPPTVLARGLGEVESFTADDTYAYVAKKGGAIVRVPLAGGEAAPFGALAPGESAMALAATAEGLYVATAAGGDAALKKGTFGQGSIVLLPSDGSKARRLSSGYVMTVSLVADDAKIYWAAAKPGKKPVWSIFSAPRKTGAPVAAKKIDQAGMTRVFGLYQGRALVAGLLGGVVWQGLGAADEAGPTVATLMQVESAAVAGDRVVIGGSDLDIEHGGKSVPTVGVSPIEGADHTLVRLATLDAEDHVGGVAVAGGAAYFTRVGTQAGHYRDGALVRVALGDKATTVLASDQFQPAGVVATARGVVWLNERGHFVMSDGDAELLLVPLAPAVAPR